MTCFPSLKPRAGPPIATQKKIEAARRVGVAAGRCLDLCMRLGFAKGHLALHLEQPKPESAYVPVASNLEITGPQCSTSDGMPPKPRGEIHTRGIILSSSVGAEFWALLIYCLSNTDFEYGVFGYEPIATKAS